MSAIDAATSILLRGADPAEGLRRAEDEAAHRGQELRIVLLEHAGAAPEGLDPTGCAPPTVAVHDLICQVAERIDAAAALGWLEPPPPPTRIRTGADLHAVACAALEIESGHGSIAAVARRLGDPRQSWHRVATADPVSAATVVGYGPRLGLRVVVEPDGSVWVQP